MSLSRQGAKWPSRRHCGIGRIQKGSNCRIDVCTHQGSFRCHRMDPRPCTRLPVSPTRPWLRRPLGGALRATWAAHDFDTLTFYHSSEAPTSHPWTSKPKVRCLRDRLVAIVEKHGQSSTSLGPRPSCGGSGDRPLGGRNRNRLSVSFSLFVRRRKVDSSERWHRGLLRDQRTHKGVGYPRVFVLPSSERVRQRCPRRHEGTAVAPTPND